MVAEDEHVRVVFIVETTVILVVGATIGNMLLPVLHMSMLERYSGRRYTITVDHS